MRIVLDTNVLVRANAKALGPARELILTIIKSSSTFFLSPFLISEVERVLSCPESVLSGSSANRIFVST